MRRAGAVARTIAPPAGSGFVARAAERLPICLDAGLLTGSGARARVRLRDISALGFMAECETFAAIGAAVRLDCGFRGQYLAEIRWALVGWFGARFEAPLAPYQLARLLEAGRGWDARQPAA